LFSGDNGSNPIYTLVDALISYLTGAWTHYTSPHGHIAVPASLRTVGVRFLAWTGCVDPGCAAGG